jgi:hypothetical protein
MTARKHLQERIRARMAKTGERYSSARRHVLNAIPPEAYRLRGGVHPETATIAGVLANRGLVAPHTGEPLSEAMVLGVGGGLGAGYILWEFKEHDRRTLVLGFRNAWQYPARWAETTCRRLRVPAAVHETGAARKADAELRATVGQGVPAIAWVDQQVVGYRQLPAALAGHAGYPLTVYGVDEQAVVVLVDDRNRARLTVPLDTLAAARARIPSYRHRLLVLDAPAAELDLEHLRSAARDGLADQVEHLARPSDSFSLPAFRKWARLLTDRRDAKAWPRVFADRAGLFDACAAIYENVAPVGAGGGNLRGLYAEFLDEAAVLLANRDLRRAAAAYRDLAARWHRLAEAALPADREPFAEVRRRTGELARLVERGDAGRREAATVAARRWTARDRWRSAFPADEDADALLAGLARRVADIYQAETAALATLGDALRAS